MAQPAMPRDAGFPIPVLAQSGANSTLKISPSGSDAASSAITARVVRIAVTANMNIEFNAAAVATTSLYMPANTVEYFSFTSGQTVHAIGTGDVYITPMA
jgi:hypothetical protein